jgi:hypothetical protein
MDRRWQKAAVTMRAIQSLQFDEWRYDPNMILLIGTFDTILKLDGP